MRTAIIILAAALALAACSGGGSGYDVTYQVGGSGGAQTASMTFFNANGDTTQQGDQPLPWSFSMAGVGSVAYVDISAQNGQGSGTVDCSISVDGQHVASNTAVGGYQICDVHATV